MNEGLGPVKITYVSIDSKGRLYFISNETSKIYVYGPDESFLFTIGEKGGTPRHLSTPKALAIDEKRGLIYVVDYMRQCILAYDMAGKYLFEFGGLGYGPGWFYYPIGLAINNHGQLIVADLFNHRVQVLEVGYEEIVACWKRLRPPRARRLLTIQGVNPRGRLRSLTRSSRGQRRSRESFRSHGGDYETGRNFYPDHPMKWIFLKRPRLHTMEQSGPNGQPETEQPDTLE